MEKSKPKTRAATKAADLQALAAAAGAVEQAPGDAVETEIDVRLFNHSPALISLHGRVWAANPHPGVVCRMRPSQMAAFERNGFRVEPIPSNPSDSGGPTAAQE